MKRKIARSLKCLTCNNETLESYQLWWTDKDADSSGYDSNVLFLQMHCPKCSFSWNHMVYERRDDWPSWFIKVVDQHGDRTTNTIV